MKYQVRPMNLHYLTEITRWRYKGFIKEIYTKPYFDSLKDEKEVVKGPGGCDGFGVLLGHNLIGLFEYYVKPNYIEIGLALNPAYVGLGYSRDFILSGIQFCLAHYHYQGDYILLHVDKENIQAYKAYLKTGFKEIREVDGEYEMRYYLV